MNLYRKTTIGEALAEALQEMREKNDLSANQTESVLQVFDSVISLIDSYLPYFLIGDERQA